MEEAVKKYRLLMPEATYQEILSQLASLVEKTGQRMELRHLDNGRLVIVQRKGEGIESLSPVTEFGRVLLAWLDAYGKGFDLGQSSVPELPAIVVVCTGNLYHVNLRKSGPAGSTFYTRIHSEANPTTSLANALALGARHVGSSFAVEILDHRPGKESHHG